MARVSHLIALTLIVATIFRDVSSYDTGHHADLTRNVMEIQGYNNYAQDVGAVSNWMVDYFSYTVGTEDIPELAALHHDNLFNLQNVSNYLTVLSRNTRNAVINVANNNDTLSFLSIIGATLHAYQDFYTHSQWTELHQSSCGCYRDDTWFSALASVQGNVTQLLPTLQSLSTYSWGDGCNPFERNCLPGQLPHGDYCEGINKDSYVRPKFESSYGFAFAGSMEWLYNLERWANESSNGLALIQQARQYIPPTQEDIDDLQKDVQASIEVSYATKTVFGEDDGHWKGSGSGDLERFATSGAAFLASSSLFKRQFSEKKFWEPLVNPNPYDQQPNDTQEYSEAVEWFVPYNQMPIQLRSFTKVKVRTWRVNIPDNLFNTPSPYAIIQIGNQEFEESVNHDRHDFYPHWTSIKFIPSSQSSIPIQYSLWNDEFPSDDDLIKVIDDSDGSLNITYDVTSRTISGDVSGVFDSKERLLEISSGDNHVSLYIMTQQYGNCVVNGLPDMFCPDEAYTQLLLQARCGKDRGVDEIGNGSNHQEGSGHRITFSLVMILLVAIILAV